VEELDQRITELELRFMQQEHTIQDLNETVYRQEQLINRLERDLALVSEQMRTSAASSGREQGSDERPPHY